MALNVSFVWPAGRVRSGSLVDAEHLTAQLREAAVEQLAQAPEDELWLIADGSDLRKPYAEAMPALMQVRDLEGDLVPGYRTLNVLGVTPGRRGILYHRLFSSEEPGFGSRTGGSAAGASDGEPGGRCLAQAHAHHLDSRPGL
jgi:hypothetical protein